MLQVWRQRRTQWITGSNSITADSCTGQLQDTHRSSQVQSTLLCSHSGCRMHSRICGLEHVGVRHSCSKDHEQQLHVGTSLIHLQRRSFSQTHRSADASGESTPRVERVTLQFCSRGSTVEKLLNSTTRKALES